MRRLALLACLASLAGCTPEEAPVEIPTDPVVVYAAYPDTTYLPSLLDAYTKETGTIVIVRHGDAEAMVDDVIRNDISPPADVLITPSVKGVYRAAEEGALRPLDSALVEEDVPAALKDPDKFWVALSYRQAAIAYDPRVFEDFELTDVEDLADEKYRGQLCLSSSSEPHNRAIIARLINKLGVREAELAVRGWVANLKRPVFEAEDKLWKAMEFGECGVSVLSHHGVAFVKNSRIDESWIHTTHPDSIDIEGVGIARHARNPDGAQGLINWLLSDDVQVRHAGSTLSIAATGELEGAKNVGIVAWHYDEAEKLAERARYH